MKTILLLLSISPFCLGSIWYDPSRNKYLPWYPFLPNEGHSKGFLTYAQGSSECNQCPLKVPIGTHRNRPSYRRHRRPELLSLQIPTLKLADEQTNQIPDSNRNAQIPVVVIPQNSSSGAVPVVISFQFGQHPKKSPKIEEPKKPPKREGTKKLSLAERLRTCDCGTCDIPNMIVRGTVVDPPFKYPWMVAIQKPTGLRFCGGAIIADQYILTAAHCFAKGTLGFLKPNEVQVAFLTNTYNLTEGENITDIIPYPSYEYLNKDHDIALLKLKEKIQCSAYRRPICLPRPGMAPLIGQQFVIAGWGSRFGGTSDRSPRLLETLIKLVDFDMCHARFSALRENFHCLLGENDSTPCHGDSGGPMFVEHGKKFYVYGVASLHNSAHCNASDVFLYTNVINYLDWIKNKMGIS